MNKKELINYLTKTDLDIQAAKAGFWPCFLVFQSYANAFKKYGMLETPVCCYISYKNSFDYFYQILKNMNEVGDKLYSDYIKDRNSLDKKINRHLELTNEMDELWKKYLKEKQSQPNNTKNILRYYKKFLRLADEWWCYGFFGEDKGEVVARVIISNFQARHNLSESEAKEIVSYLAHPEEMAVFNQERLLFLELCVALSNLKVKENDKFLEDKKVEKILNDYLKNFFWFKTDFYSARIIFKEDLIREALAEIKKIGISNIKTEIKGIKNNFNSISKNKKKILNQFKLTSDDKKDIYFARRIFYWFDQRKLGMMKHFYYLFNLLTEISKLKSLDYQTLSLYNLQEVEDLLVKNKKVDKKKIEKRNSGVFVVFQSKKPADLYYQKEARELFELATQVKNSKFLSGSVASTAGVKKIVGKVKIIINPEKTEFNKSEILVTSMTRIEFVPLMRRALAIITNEGGIACHAAIVSREMNKPAIIGTKSATRILKDGDEVEMNMQTGEIKIKK